MDRKQQRKANTNTNKRLMDEQNRMPLQPTKKIRHPKLKPKKPHRTQPINTKIHQMEKQKSTKKENPRSSK